MSIFFYSKVMATTVAPPPSLLQCRFRNKKGCKQNKCASVHYCIQNDAICKTGEICALVKILKIGYDDIDVHVNMGLKVHLRCNMVTLQMFIEQPGSC